MSYVIEYHLCIPSEKKSTAGAADTLGAAGVFVGRCGILPSSTEIFDRPFFNEGGRKAMELVVAVISSISLFVFVDANSASSPSSSTLLRAGATDGLEVLKTRPGPLPPPSTRSGAGSVGTFCFGAGSIDTSPDAPAPDSNRGFFAAGLSSSSLGSSPGRAGSPIVIFFGPRLFLGGGRERPLPDALELDGGGSAIDDFLPGVGSFEANDDFCDCVPA